MDSVVNPLNEKIDSRGVFSKSVSDNVPLFLYIYSGLTFIIGGIGLLIIKDFDKYYPLETY